MAKISRLFPFGIWPSNWGMAGKRRAEAEAEYYWDGEDLAYMLLDIRNDDKESRAYRREKLKLDYRYHKAIKAHVNFQVAKQQKLSYWGMPMWFLTIEVPGGLPDIKRLVEVFPPKLMVNDYGWGYDFYLK